MYPTMWLLLSLSFLQIGLLGLGGSPGAQAVLEYELMVMHPWLTPDELADLMALCRVLPGGTGIDVAAYTGFRVAGVQGSLWAAWGGGGLCVLSLAASSVLWTAALTSWEASKRYRPLLDCVLTLLRPLVPGLLVAAALLMMNAENFGVPQTDAWQFGISVFLFFAALIGVGVCRISAWFMVLLCGLAGWLLL